MRWRSAQTAAGLPSRWATRRSCYGMSGQPNRILARRIAMNYLRVAALAVLLFAPVAASAADPDLKKVDRTIGREPAYVSKQPQYCLLVFGPKATTRVWLVIDGDFLYIDRNGNGDLTEPGERVRISTFREIK